LTLTSKKTWSREPGVSRRVRCFYFNLSENFQEQGARALVAMTNGAAAGAVLCVLDEKLKLIPHDIICIRRRD